MERAGSSATYGELTPRGAALLFEVLRPKSEDTLIDLGSGIGRVVMHAALATKVKLAVGVEMTRARHRIACSRLARAREWGWEEADRVQFELGDFMRRDFSGFSLIYACSTAFPDEFLSRVVRKAAHNEPGARLVVFSPLDENPWFERRETMRLDTTWRRGFPVHIYELVRPYGFSRAGRKKAATSET